MNVTRVILPPFIHPSFCLPVCLSSVFISLCIHPTVHLRLHTRMHSFSNINRCFLLMHPADGKCIGTNLKDNQILCGNGDIRNFFYQSCGDSRGGRVACPPNSPYLCVKKNCGFYKTDRCCKSSSCSSNDGGNFDCTGAHVTLIILVVLTVTVIAM